MIRRSSVAVLLVAASLAAAPAKEPPAPAADATLTVIERVQPGVTTTTVEYARGDTLVRSTVTSHYNVPTGEGSVRGDLRAVYLVVAERPHPDPTSLNGPAALLKALRELPLAVTKAGERGDGGPEPRETRYAITFTRRADPTKPAPPPTPPSVPK